MKKYQMKLAVIAVSKFESGYIELTLRRIDGEAMPEIRPGQFVNILVEGAKDTFLRVPISVNDVDYDSSLLKLLVKNIGPGTAKLYASEPGDEYDILFPLGHGFETEGCGKRVLLVGGGVGTAPLLYLSSCLSAAGIRPTVLLGARNASELVQNDLFAAVADLAVSTEDGSAGEQGLVTTNSVLSADYDDVMVCGPLPMMKAVAKIARERGWNCQVSLESRMACGLGACLCCVEDTKEGHKCTCTEGPVFNLNELKWEL